jgi:hypothetical protein
LAKNLKSTTRFHIPHCLPLPKTMMQALIYAPEGSSNQCSSQQIQGQQAEFARFSRISFSPKT